MRFFKKSTRAAPSVESLARSRISSSSLSNLEAVFFSSALFWADFFSSVFGGAWVSAAVFGRSSPIKTAAVIATEPAKEKNQKKRMSSILEADFRFVVPPRGGKKTTDHQRRRARVALPSV